MELKEDETNEAMQKNEDTSKLMEDNMKSAILYDNRIMEPIAELFISNNTSHFRLRVKPNSLKEMFINITCLLQIMEVC